MCIRDRDGTTPRFAPNVKTPGIESKELTIYYDLQCPYIHQNIEMIKQHCEESKIPVSFIQVDTCLLYTSLRTDQSYFIVITQRFRINTEQLRHLTDSK